MAMHRCPAALTHQWWTWAE